MSRLNVDANVMILATDAASAEFFLDHGWPAVYHPSPMQTGYLKHEKGRTHWTRMHVWFERVRAVQHLLQLGYTVVHSDADALWFKNPLPELDALAKSGHDLIFSRGNAAGGKNAGHGLGVCGGFYYAAPSAGSVAFFTDVLRAMHARNMPDQPAMNSLLWAGGVGRSQDMMDPDPW